MGNKNGELTGTKEVNKQNFANDKDLASKAGKKGNKTATAATQAITKSSAIVEGRHKKITPEIQNLIRNELIEPDSKGNVYIHTFIQNFLNAAKKDPNSAAAKLLANAIFKDDLLATLDESIVKQEQRDRDFNIWQIRSTLYDKQQDVFDNEVDKTILIINSRRSGKTELMGRLAVKGLLLPDAHVVYINRNSSAAIRQIRKPLETALNKIGLKCIKGSVDNQEMHFENGSQLLILGNNNAADIDKLRGERISMCIMDECGHQRNVKQLIREVISPALKDYGSLAKMYMVGTPPRIPHTYVEELWNNQNVKKYHWTFMDNPYIPEREYVIEDVCKEFGVSPDAAFIRREYFGEMGVFDTEAQVFYGFQKGSAPANITYTHAYIGVDWGFEDKAAVVSVVADSKTKKAYIVKDWSMSKQSISTICEEVVAQRNYIQSNFNVINSLKIITDTNEKSAAYELTETYKLPNVTLAYKYDKDMAIELLAEWLRAGTIITTDNAKACIDDFTNTLWERDEETDKLTHNIDDDLYHPNAAMALLYISRQFDYDSMVTGYSKTARDIVSEFLTK